MAANKQKDIAAGPMTKDEFNDAKTLWKLFYAHESFRQAEAACAHIIEQNLETDHPLYYPLLTSVYVLYGKPFKRANVVGRLTDEIVPPEHKQLHEEILGHRDQFYAHTDAKNFKLSEFGQASQVRVLVTPGEVHLLGTQFRARPAFLPEVVELCKLLREKVDYRLEKIQKRHMSKIPFAPGEYIINILDESGPLLLKEKPFVLKHL